MSNVNVEKYLDEIQIDEGANEYQKFFQSKLKKYGIKSPFQLKGDKEKKKFYNEVEVDWKIEKAKSK
jgi:hypothetical protein